MKRAVLADTGPLYAAADPDDAHHQRARRELRRLARESLGVLVAHPTLAEGYTLVLYRLGREAAANWLRDILSGAALVNPSPEDYQEGIRKLALRCPAHAVIRHDRRRVGTPPGG